VTAPLLAPVIPSSRVRETRQRPGAAAGRPLPLAHPEAVPPAPGDVVYGIGRIDASGRIADRTVTSALGWSGGDRLTLTADAGRRGRHRQRHVHVRARHAHRGRHRLGRADRRTPPPRGTAGRPGMTAPAESPEESGTPQVITADQVKPL
jgi:hypothetical protein